MFSIVCSNCRAKLKVSKPELIGQNLACPRCGTMVNVVAPADWVAENAGSDPAKPTSQTSGGSAANQKQIKSPTSAPSEKVKRPRPTAVHPEDLQETLPSVGEAEWGEDLRLEEPVDRPAMAPALGAGPKFEELDESTLAAAAKRTARDNSKSEPKSSASDGPLIPDQWVSERTRRRRVQLLISISVLGVVLLSLVLGSQLFQSGSQPVDTADDTSSQTRPANDGANQPDKNPLDTNLQRPDNSAPEANGNDPPPLPAEDTHPNDRDQGTVENPAQPSNLNPPQNQVAGTEDSTENGTGTPSPSERLAGLGNAESGQSFQSVMNDIFGQELTSDFDDPALRRMLERSNDPMNEVLRRVAEEQPRRKQSARVRRPIPRQVDIQSSLNMRVSGLLNPQIRLPQLMALAERLTSVPIWIDIERYQGQPLSLDQAISLEAVQTTIPDLLAANLDKYGFAFDLAAWNSEQPELQGIRLFPQGSEVRELKTYTLPWSANSTPEQLQQDLRTVAQMIGSFVAPGRWASEPLDAPLNVEALPSGQGSMRIEADSLEITHEPFVQRQVERLFEQLRIANENADPRLWPDSLKPRALQSGPRLRAVVQVQQHQLTPIHKLLQDLYSQTELTVLVDWPSLIQDGWTPDTELPLVAHSTSVENVLREMCMDMELSLRVLTPDVVCLLSDKAADQMADLEIYPVGDLVPNPKSWDLLRGRLGRLLEIEFIRFPSAYLYYEPRFNCIVARMPQSMHRRLQLYLDAARRN